VRPPLAAGNAVTVGWASRPVRVRICDPRNWRTTTTPLRYATENLLHAASALQVNLPREGRAWKPILHRRTPLLLSLTPEDLVLDAELLLHGRDVGLEAQGIDRIASGLFQPCLPLGLKAVEEDHRQFAEVFADHRGQRDGEVAFRFRFEADFRPVHA